MLRNRVDANLKDAPTCISSLYFVVGSDRTDAVDLARALVRRTRSKHGTTVELEPQLPITKYPKITHSPRRSSVASVQTKLPPK